MIIKLMWAEIIALTSFNRGVKSSSQLTDQDLFVHYPEGLMDMERALSEPIGGASYEGELVARKTQRRSPITSKPNPCGRHPKSYYPHATHIEQATFGYACFKSSWAEASSLERRLFRRGNGRRSNALGEAAQTLTTTSGVIDSCSAKLYTSSFCC